jgi:hypothetical protein
MISKSLKFVTLAIAIITLAGCSSNEAQKQLEAAAAHRAGTLSAGLPMEYGPLTVLQAKARGSVIELTMVYNDTGTRPASQLMARSINYYCSNQEVKSNLDMGISYTIKMRNSRGQLLAEQSISSNSCN